MILLFGMRVLFTTVEEGQFACPRCHADRVYRLRRGRRWFTLFFIPIIPLNRVGEVVECTVCGSRFHPEVLERPTATTRSDWVVNAMRMVVAALLRTGGAADPAVRRAAVLAVRGLGGDYDDAHVEGDLTQTDPGTLPQYLSPLDEPLPVELKERFVGDAARVALADGSVEPAERAVLDEVGRLLGLTTAHVTGLIAEAATAAESTPRS